MLKQLFYLTHRRPLPPEKPTVIQFPVIDICNSQCQMCRIWENKQGDDDLTPEQLRRGLRNPLYSEVVAVGINGGEPTLRKDLAALATVLFEELPRLRQLSLITNAYRHEEVVTRIREVSEVARRHGGRLDVMVSLDGVGEVHDRVRGKPGNFARAARVTDFLLANPAVATLRFGCTIIKENVWGLADLLDYAQSRGVYIKFRLGIPHQRLYTGGLVAPYALDEAERYHVAAFLEGVVARYETGEAQNFFYRSLIDQIRHHAPRRAGCDWQHRGATITSRGELLYCAVQSKALGRIQDADSQQLYFGNADHLREIVATKCATCVHDYNGVPPRGPYLRQFLLQVLKDLRLERTARAFYRSAPVAGLRQRMRFHRRRKALRAAAAAAPAPRGAGPVLICGWYGTETAGDKAILAGVVGALRGAGAREFAVASLHPHVTEMTCRQMPELAGVRVLDMAAAAQVAGRASLVVFGGGPLMAIEPLGDIEALFEAARRNEVPTVLAGCGVGPLGAGWLNRSLVRLLRLASHRIFRDEASRQLAARLGADTSKDAVAEDPAFAWLAQQRPPAREPQGGKVLLLGLREFPAAEYAAHLGEARAAALAANWERVVAQALLRLVRSDPALVLRPIPMCTHHHGGDDRWFFRRFLRGSPELAERVDRSLLYGELAPAQYVNEFARADAVLAMRFHSLVFANALGIPAVAIDYTLGKGKVHALAQASGVAAQSLEELSAEFLVDALQRCLAGSAARTVAPPRFESALQAVFAAATAKP
jgi:polysaccharide pyruvyl transferase WcaK-like protein/sulfatase maturation enzyme AslB (radical SAM superfamily)